MRRLHAVHVYAPHTAALCLRVSCLQLMLHACMALMGAGSDAKSFFAYAQRVYGVQERMHRAAGAAAPPQRWTVPPHRLFPAVQTLASAVSAATMRSH